MGVTRKERLLKAMLNDNAEACRGGVSREERIIASVSKKVCDNDALEGGGGTGGGGGSCGCGAGSTVTTYTINKASGDFTSQGLQVFDGNAQHWLLVEGDFDGKTLIGSSYTITKMDYEDNDEGIEKTTTYVTDSSMYRYEESNGLKYEHLGDRLVILQAGRYETGEWGMTVDKPGIYFVSYGGGETVNELVVSVNTPIDEKYMPQNVTLNSMTILDGLILKCDCGYCYHKLKVDCDGNLGTELYEFEEDE